MLFGGVLIILSNSASLNTRKGFADPWHSGPTSNANPCMQMGEHSRLTFLRLFAKPTGSRCVDPQTTVTGWFPLCLSGAGSQ